MYRTTKRIATLSAIAAGTALALLGGTTRPAAADQVVRGKNCPGDAVQRCVWIIHDDVAGRITAHARVTDVTGGPSRRVAVSNVRLQFQDSYGWHQLGAEGTDYDGWWDYRETARSGSALCFGTVTYYRAVAVFKWTPSGRPVTVTSRNVPLQC